MATQTATLFILIVASLAIANQLIKNITTVLTLPNLKYQLRVSLAYRCFVFSAQQEWLLGRMTLSCPLIFSSG